MSSGFSRSWDSTKFLWIFYPNSDYFLCLDKHYKMHNSFTFVGAPPWPVCLYNVMIKNNNLKMHFLCKIMPLRQFNIIQNINNKVYLLILWTNNVHTCSKINTEVSSTLCRWFISKLNALHSFSCSSSENSFSS